jgi:uncharacterized phage infection (PIP) family protein YhgE
VKRVFLSFGKVDIGKELQDIAIRLQRIEDIVAKTWAEVVGETTTYISELKAQRDEAVAALTDAQATAQSNADALATFQADDAATDAQQLADAEQRLADELAAAVDAVKNPPAEPEPLPEQPPAEPAPEG